MWAVVMATGLALASSACSPSTSGTADSSSSTGFSVSSVAAAPASSGPAGSNGSGSASEPIASASAASAPASSAGSGGAVSGGSSSGSLPSPLTAATPTGSQPGAVTGTRTATATAGPGGHGPGVIPTPTVTATVTAPTAVTVSTSTVVVTKTGRTPTVSNGIQFADPAKFSRNGGQDVAFASPSSNVHCLIGQSGAIDCVITTISGGGPSGCDSGPVAIRMTGDSAVSLSCGGSPAGVSGGYPTLAYNLSLTFHGVTCLSTESSGVQCSAGAHQFTAARSGVHTL